MPMTNDTGFLKLLLLIAVGLSAGLSITMTV